MFNKHMTKRKYLKEKIINNINDNKITSINYTHIIQTIQKSTCKIHIHPKI